MNNGKCGSKTLAEPDISFGSAPLYAIMAVETNIVGYTVPVCYLCTLTVGAITFEKMMTIEGLPLNC